KIKSHKKHKVKVSKFRIVSQPLDFKEETMQEHYFSSVLSLIRNMIKINISRREISIVSLRYQHKY
ncbi:hypothetical protein, partial [Enterobacter hormaechei]|uniref:hypothetical protein n=1 Tax=Enterobacter hormaechei TaxID=158836 RepID=UPI001C534611